MGEACEADAVQCKGRGNGWRFPTTQMAMRFDEWKQAGGPAFETVDEVGCPVRALLQERDTICVQKIVSAMSSSVSEPRCAARFWYPPFRKLRERMGHPTLLMVPARSKAGPPAVGIRAHSGRCRTFSLRQAGGELPGTGTGGKLQRWSKAVGTHQQAGQFDGAVPVGGNRAGHGKK